MLQRLHHVAYRCLEPIGRLSRGESNESSDATPPRRDHPTETIVDK